VQNDPLLSRLSVESYVIVVSLLHIKVLNSFSKNTAVLHSTYVLKQEIYIYFIPEACDVFNNSGETNLL